MALPKYYTSLFNAVALAIAEIDDQNHGQARKVLVNALKVAEDYYIEDETFLEYEFDYLDDKLEYQPHQSLPLRGGGPQSGSEG